MQWQERIFYQIYPLGFCGAERTNDFKTQSHRLGKIEREIQRLKELGIGAVLFNPLFKSVAHGYDTVDFFTTDNRLGTNAELSALVKKFHEADIKVVFDGVFNHVGREFEKFRDVREKKWDSPFKDWFKTDFGGNSPYNDGFWYEGWEGHYELVKLNLYNRDVRNFLFDAARFWIDEFDIDGLRLDVGYSLPEDFIRELCSTVKSKKQDFFVVAEAIHGDYNRLMNAGADSVTNYECYKGLYSAINSVNLFEIEHSLSRQFADTPWALYKGKQLLNFIDNHDVPRAYSIINDKRNVAAAYAVLTVMPGIPCIYYGSEYGAEGVKGDGDIHLRPDIDTVDKAAHADLYEQIKRLIAVRNDRKSLQNGSYSKVSLSNGYFSVMRVAGGEKTVLAVNITDSPAKVGVGGDGTDILNGESVSGQADVQPHSYRLFDIK